MRSALRLIRRAGRRGAEELEGAPAVLEDVSAPWKRDWSGQHSMMWRQRGTRTATCNEASELERVLAGLSCRPPKAAFA